MVFSEMAPHDELGVDASDHESRLSCRHGGFSGFGVVEDNAIVGDLPLERFAIEVLGLEMVERTSTTAVAAGRLRRQRVAILFEAVPRPPGGSRLVTETRVADVDLGFRVYWFVVGPFSALIRRRWLRAVAGRP